MSSLGSFLLVVFILWALDLVDIVIHTDRMFHIIGVIVLLVVLIRLIQGKKII